MTEAGRCSKTARRAPASHDLFRRLTRLEQAARYAATPLPEAPQLARRGWRAGLLGREELMRACFSRALRGYEKLEPLDRFLCLFHTGRRREAYIEAERAAAGGDPRVLARLCQPWPIEAVGEPGRLEGALCAPAWRWFFRALLHERAGRYEAAAAAHVEARRAPCWMMLVPGRALMKLGRTEQGRRLIDASGLEPYAGTILPSTRGPRAPVAEGQLLGLPSSVRAASQAKQAASLAMTGSP